MISIARDGSSAFRRRAGKAAAALATRPFDGWGVLATDPDSGCGQSLSDPLEDALEQARSLVPIETAGYAPDTTVENDRGDAKSFSWG